MNERDKRVWKRANLILEIAARQAAKHSDHSVSNAVEVIQLHSEGYAEKGCQDFAGVVATGDWNDVVVYNSRTRERVKVSVLPYRIKRIFEKLGIEIEWCDEWSTCDDCSKLFRTVADNHYWQPSYSVNVRDGWKRCLDCSKPKPNEQED